MSSSCPRAPRRCAHTPGIHHVGQHQARVEICTQEYKGRNRERAPTSEGGRESERETGTLYSSSRWAGRATNENQPSDVKLEKEGRPFSSLASTDLSTPCLRVRENECCWCAKGRVRKLRARLTTYCPAMFVAVSFTYSLPPMGILNKWLLSYTSGVVSAQ